MNTLNRTPGMTVAPVPDPAFVGAIHYAILGSGGQEMARVWGGDNPREALALACQFAASTEVLANAKELHEVFWPPSPGWCPRINKALNELHDLMVKGGLA